MGSPTQERTPKVKRSATAPHRRRTPTRLLEEATGSQCHRARVSWAASLLNHLHGEARPQMSATCPSVLRPFGPQSDAAWWIKGKKRELEVVLGSLVSWRTPANGAQRPAPLGQMGCFVGTVNRVSLRL